MAEKTTQALLGLDAEPQIAYFTMEIGIREEIPTYAGGLGILAGDFARSAADLGVPFIVITLLYKKGYFRQRLSREGKQIEYAQPWPYKKILKPLPVSAKVKIEGRNVQIKPWHYPIKGLGGSIAHVLFLDTDLEENAKEDREITHELYGRDLLYRLKQEIVLGIGGIRILKNLGAKIKKFHMNEGHASFLALELLRTNKMNKKTVREMCVFTTHTPIEAGHDRFPYELVEKTMGKLIPKKILRNLGGAPLLSTTKLAFNMSNYINGVAKRHQEISLKLFPGYNIRAITNGIHAPTWVHPAFKKLFDKYLPGWIPEPELLTRSHLIPDEDYWAARDAAKKECFSYIKKMTGVKFSKDIFTIAFARRMTEYKRPTFIFSDIERLKKINRKFPLQIVFAGKAHPKDEAGKKLIQEIFQKIKILKKEMKIAYLPNYDIGVAKKLVSGVDLWLNNPQTPNEACGTSGMKAACNGVVNFSVLDGWWLEGFIEGVTGWSIGPLPIETERLQKDEIKEYEIEDLYSKLEYLILPTFYHRRDQWVELMENSIGKIAYHFNSHRMLRRYVLYAYL